MIKDSGENEVPNKQEGGTSDQANKHQRRTRQQWSSLSNPRIVRVSSAFGGKDRHSKVSTIRGLRDRRVRLSVPTAIQLYDLQDKLHLNQPSKVVDWLIDAAQQEIDKLPPLPLIPASFIQFPHPLASSSAADVVLNDIEHINTTNNRVQSFSFNAVDPMLSSSNVVEDISFSKFKGITKDHIDIAMPYTSYHQWEPSNNAYTSDAAENTSQAGSTTPQEIHLASALSMLPRSMMHGPQFMMPTLMPSSYVTSPNHFQWNSYSQHVNHQEQHHEEQQEDSMRESSRHAGHGSNTAPFF